MIIQCMECQTRFRLADEKIKPTGTKVRCSKCKHVFTVMPPEPEPAESAEESVDYGDFNMEKVDEPETGEPPPAHPEPPAEPAQSHELDFSGLEKEMGERADSGELADDFAFAPAEEAAPDETSPETEESTAADEQAFDFDFEDASASDTSPSGIPPEEPDAALAEDLSPDQPAPEAVGADGEEEFDFDQENATPEEFGFEADAEPPKTEAQAGEFDFSPDSEAAQEFTFDEEEPAQSPPDAETTEFSFDDQEDSQALDFDDRTEADTFAEDREPTSFGPSEEGGPQEFSFDEEEPAFGEETSVEWGEGQDDESPSFDFDEPTFETEAPADQKAASEPESDLQFGEINFSDDADQGGPGAASDEDFSGATLAREEEDETRYAEPARDTSASSRPARESEEPPLQAPAKKKGKGKRSGSRVLVLLVLLLLALGGGAGYIYLEDGGFNLAKIGQRFPFLQPYLGQPAAIEAAPQIAINITSTSYVTNREAGQLLVIQGEAVNNYPGSRSAITVKGILYDEQGNPLLQQTVFCGNPLGEERLRTMPFSEIEEAMNNQFGDSLSNMNVSSGASIPFTIVVRNLPEDIANINIVLVDSEPGSG